MTTAIIGIGNIGGTVARDLAAGGEHVVLSASNLDEVKKLAAEIGSSATAATSNRDAVERRQRCPGSLVGPDEGRHRGYF
jgi:predicted dinucleotide-binding enzyme